MIDISVFSLNSTHKNRDKFVKVVSVFGEGKKIYIEFEEVEPELEPEKDEPILEI